MAELATEGLSPTVQAVASALGDTPASAQELVEGILERHRSDYGGGRAAGLPVEWPADPRRAAAATWLDDIRRLLTREQHPELHGRAVILGVALADPPSGRAMAESGLLFAVLSEFRSPPRDGLTAEGLQRLTAIPLVGAMTGVAMGGVTMGGPVHDVAFSPGGQLIAAASDGGWAVYTRVRRQLIQAGPERARGLVFAEDGRRLLVTDDRGASLVELRSGSDPRRVADDEVMAAGFGPDGGLAVTRNDVVTLPDGRRRPGGGDVAAVSPTAAAVAVATAGRGRVTVTDRLGEDLAALRGHSGNVAHVAFGRDGSVLASVDGSGIVRLWNIASGALLWSRPEAGDGDGLSVSPRGDRVLVGSLLLDAMSGELVAALDPAADLVSAAFSPDGRFVATGAPDGAAQLWNATTGAEVARLQHPGPVRCLAWPRDGGQLLTGTDRGNVAVWAAALAPPEVAPLAAYSADDVRAADDLDAKLEIDRDVDALASLIAARAVVPPLSVGLFGDWGSGKTFFMRRLRRRIERIARDTRDSGQLQRDVAFHKRIAHIEFNAWHYAEGNLWASLVEHILGNLRVAPDEPEDRVTERQRLLVAEIAKQRGVAEAAHAEIDATRSALDATRIRQQELGTELGILAAEDPLASASPMKAVVELVSGAITAAGGPAPGDTIADLRAGIDHVRGDLARGAGATAALLRAPDRDRRMHVLLIGVGAAVLVALVTGVLLSLLAPDAVAAAVTAVTGVAALVGGAVRWLHGQASWAAARLNELDTAAQALAEPARRAQEAHRQELERLRTAHDEAVRVGEAEEARLRRLEATLRATTPSQMLAQLVADRVDSGDYRRHLGVLALVRRDFEAISDFLRLQAEQTDACETLADEERDDDGRIGRIVLYIDDLDRCKPHQVVEVLQAVHLLLAFPLFVVVVGVDVRWVERSLALRHRWLLDSGGARPRDYLEKIFQIPFWVEPLDPDGTRRMLHDLLAGELESAPEPQVRSRAEDAPTVEQAEAPPARDGNGAGPPPVPAPAAPVLRPPPLEMQPEGLRIGPVEMERMEALAPLLGRSPRALKRFVNTYRLLKVRADDPDAFLADGDFETVLFLLALCTGAPTLAAAFLDHILGNAQGRVRTVLQTLAAPAEDYERVRRWFDEDASRRWTEADVATLREWAGEVLRFTFHWLLPGPRPEAPPEA